MGTSTMGSDLHSDKKDKLLKLQARKKELELILAAKNEELYKLCVQEVQLTGIMPPEAPLSPEVPQQRERLGSVRSVTGSGKLSESDELRDTTDSVSTRRHRHAHADHGDPRVKNLSHRLSTPSISGTSIKSSQSRHARRAETSCSNYYPSPPHDRAETFSMHNSHTYPSLSNHIEQPLEQLQASPECQPVYRHHTMTNEYMNKIYYNNVPEAHNATRLRETHFSSSHPDITTTYTHGSVTPQHVQAPQPSQPNGMRSTPLLFQYATHLKAQNQHLSGLSHQHHTQSKRRSEVPRRNTLQRTQTYHLTAHSDYNNHLENIADAYRSPPQPHQHRSQTDVAADTFDQMYLPMERPTVPNTLPLREQNMMRNPMMPLQVSTDDFQGRMYQETMSPVSQMSGYSQSNFDSVSMKSKEKQWYETSLDSPPGPSIRVEPPLLMKKAASLKRSPSVGNAQPYEIMTSLGRHSTLQTAQPLQSALSPQREVPLESPKNLTVVEQGKWIPYREVTKPFEMSDFYKYSQKFRQANATKPANTLPSSTVSGNYLKSPMELPQYATQEHWHSQNN